MPSDSGEVEVRPIKKADLQHIHQILDHYVKNTVTTFWIETPPLSKLVEEYETLAAKNYPYLVAVKKVPGSDSSPDTEAVVGYINSHGYSPRPGYDHTSEITILLHPEYKYGGAGSKLMNGLLWHLRNPGKVRFGVEGQETSDWTQCDVRQLLAIMSVDVEGRDGGLGLRDFYKRFGFVESAYLKDVGYKMDRWIDVIFMQLKIDPVIEEGSKSSD